MTRRRCSRDAVVVPDGQSHPGAVNHAWSADHHHRFDRSPARRARSRLRPASVGRLGRRPADAGAAGAAQPDVLVLDVRGQTQLPSALAVLKRQHPATSVILVASQLDPALMLEAMRAGVNECVAEPLQPSRLGARDHARHRAAHRARSAVRSSPSSAPRAASARRRWRSTSRPRWRKLEPAATLLIDLHVAYGDAAVLLRRRAAVLGRRRAREHASARRSRSSTA